jgi:hypothetical protein
LAASATTDTTNADNITSGTLGTSRLSGSYTGVTGVGTLTAGTWNATAIGAAYGGTGFTSYAVGDLLYADTTTSLAKLADVAVGNALISGGVAAAPSWGKIGLATHVSGTLPIANGGTNSTATPTNGGVVYGTGTAQAYSTAGTSGQVLTSAGAAAPTWTTATSANTASAIVQRDGSGNFTAGTITAALTGNVTGNVTGSSGSCTGNAATATTATNANYLNSAGNLTNLNTYLNSGTFSWGLGATGAPESYGQAITITSTGTAWNQSNNWATQLAFGTNADSAYFRTAVNATTWSAWRTFLHSANYNSYSPTLTGTGASGTWGINVTGSAATATTASTITNAGSGIYAAASGTAYSSVVCVREAGNGGAGASAPRLGFHWGGVVASSIAIEASGRIAIANNPGTGYEALVSNTFTSVGNVTAYSDERVKTNWRDLQPDFIEQLAKIKHGIYDRTDQEITQVGVSAQSLRPVLEHAVMEDEEGKLSVSYGNAALVACIKLAERVLELEAKLEQLTKDKS